MKHHQQQQQQQQLTRISWQHLQLRLVKQQL
jgi:hypothetical protein